MVSSAMTMASAPLMIPSQPVIEAESPMADGGMTSHAVLTACPCSIIVGILHGSWLTSVGWVVEVPDRSCRGRSGALCNSLG